MRKESKSDLRRKAMLAFVASAPITTPGQLVERFEVSAETVRRDLEQLVQEGLIYRVHGGVAPMEQQNNEKPLDLRSCENTEEKRRIAAAACRLIEPGDAVIIESGTTMMELACALREQKELLRTILVITMSLDIANILRDCEGLRLFFLGGWLRSGDLFAYGQHTLGALRDFNADKAFISGAGLNDKLVLTDYFDEEVVLRKQILDCAKSTVLLVDSSKFYKTRLLNVCHISRVERIITDSGCSQMMKRAVEEAGVKITIV